MHVDPKYHRHFVARRGELLHGISEQYGGVTVSFPRSGIDSDRVVLKGTSFELFIHFVIVFSNFSIGIRCQKLRRGG